MFKYLIFYFYEEASSVTGHGNVAMNFERKINSQKDIREIQERIKKAKNCLSVAVTGCLQIE